jgi:hypothetical protein
MDHTPKVEVSGTHKSDAQNTANNPSNEVEMGGTQEAANTQSEPAEKPDQTVAAGEDIILVDAQPDPEPPNPAKKSAVFKFLE